MRATLRSFVAVSLLLLASACLFEPANETELASVATPVEFRGVAYTPRTTVVIEAATAPDGPFVQIATATTDAHAVVQGGASTYAFSTTAAIPRSRWAQTCAGRETFVRARGGNLVFTSYDSAAIAGLDAETCIANWIADGRPFVYAAATCQSIYGAPARLRVEGGGLSTTTLSRNLRVVSQFHAQDYACLTQIVGNLTITDPTAAAIEFPELAAVTGSLQAVYPRRLGNSRAIDLPLLASVGGDVSVSSAPLPGDQGASAVMAFGMPALTQIGGNLAIAFQGEGSGFDSVSGFDTLAALAADLEVGTPASSNDTGFSGLLPELQSVAGDVELRPGLSTTALLGALVSVGGSFALNAGSLNSIGNFAALASIDGDASIELVGVQGDDLPALETVGGSLAVHVGDFGLGPGERYFPVLGEVGGVLHVFETEAALGALGAAAVDAGGLTLEANPALVDLASDVGHVDVANNGPITIIDNPGISDCDAADWVDGLPGHNGPVVISGNGPC